MNIAKLMTPFPHTIRITETLEKAERMMRDYQVRHLPVMDGGNLIGIFSERDLERAKSKNEKSDGIENSFSHGTLIFDPETRLEDVCRRMVETKTECALICDNRKLVGLFSWIDALKYFAH